MIDIVSVFHNDRNRRQAERLVNDLDFFEGPRGGRYSVTLVDNTVDNRGFAKGCNFGAKFGVGDIVGFLNPDLVVAGPFIDPVEQTLTRAVITGCRFDKPDRELKIWGVHDWVCGAAMFVKRDYFESVGGFDEQFVWGWEETDLIRQAQQARQRVVSIDLPFFHESPSIDTPLDSAYKNHHFERGARLFREKWNW